MYYELNGKDVTKVQGGIREMAERNVQMSKTLFKNRFGDVEVSTIFLAVDHGLGQGRPILFETMIFGGEHGGSGARYHTYEEAEAGHKTMCEMVDKVSIERDRRLNELGL